MTPVISTRPGTELTDAQAPDRGPSLAELAALGAEELAARLRRALPGAEAGRVAVAAFNSSI
ncbi:FxSxx-COOH cyclophane-containing RiPP peptide [Kitasatospora sp. NPDC059327]|uniref:FxSxx-COOH cyclophane-containing RiPP peptide n=1 Tax=Kitasatospora sp. NPDC059327 TaxID=3346803 RepID=UPI003690DC58